MWGNIVNHWTTVLECRPIIIYSLSFSFDDSILSQLLVDIILLNVNPHFYWQAESSSNVHERSWGHTLTFSLDSLDLCAVNYVFYISVEITTFLQFYVSRLSRLVLTSSSSWLLYTNDPVFCCHPCPSLSGIWQDISEWALFLTKHSMLYFFSRLVHCKTRLGN